MPTSTRCSRSSALRPGKVVAERRAIRFRRGNERFTAGNERLLVDRRTQSNTACPARPRVLWVRPRGQRRLASPGGLRGPLPRGRVTVRTTSATARCAARVGLGAARAGAERESLGSENAVGDSSDLLDDATYDGDSVARIT